MYNHKDMEEVRELGFWSGVKSTIYSTVAVVVFIGFVWLACMLTVGM